MENNATSVKISHLQLAAILAVSVLFTLTAAPQGTIGGVSNMRFLSFPVGVLFMFALYAPLIIFTAKNEDNALKRSNRVLRWFFGAVILARIICSALITVSQLRVFVMKTIMPYMPAIVFVGVILLAAMYGANQGIQATARTAPIALLVLIFVFIAVSVLLRDRIDPVHIYSPLGEGGWLASAFEEAAGIDEIFFFAVLSGFVRGKTDTQKNPPKKKAQGFKSIMYYLPAVLVTGLWLNFLFISVLGRSLSLTPYPMNKVATFSSLHFVERMDGVFATAAVFAGLLKLTVAFICVRAVIYELSMPSEKAQTPENPEKTERVSKIITSVLIVATGVLAYFAVGRDESFMTGRWADIYYLASLAVIALFLPAAALISGRKSKTGGKKEGAQ